MLALIIGLSACKTKNNEVTIKGKIIGELTEYLKHSEPVNGICLGYFHKQIEIDSSGYFEFKIITAKPVFTGLYYPENDCFLIVEPGETYNIEIDCNQNKVKIEGRNEKLIEIYQNLLMPMHPNIEYPKYRDLSIPVIKFKVDSMYNQEHQIFVELYNKNEISNEVFKLVDFDRHLFYQSLLSSIFKLQYFEIILNNREAKTDSISNALNTAVTSVPVDSEIFLNSRWAYYYLESYLESKEFEEKEYYLDDRKDAREKDLYHTYRIGFSNKYLSGELHEFYNSAYILVATNQEKFEKELITLFEEFKTDFPESKYTPFIEPHINDVIDFHQKANLDFDEEVHFIDDYKNINSLDELLKSFKGQKVYIDIWATWCGYCKDEFKYSKEVKQMLDSKNISMLYISIDDDSRKQQWMDMIKYYDLKGYHVLANNKLDANLDSILNRSGVPHYVLIDENGKLIKNDAPYPSQMKELKELIENN